MNKACIDRYGRAECDPRDLKTLEDRPDWDHDCSRQGMKICRCKKCGQLWKVRYQWDAGTGSDDIWVKPGECDRHVSFSLAEAAKYQEVRE